MPLAELAKLVTPSGSEKGGFSTWNSLSRISDTQNQKDRREHRHVRAPSMSVAQIGSVARWRIPTTAHHQQSEDRTLRERAE